SLMRTSGCYRNNSCQRLSIKRLRLFLLDIFLCPSTAMQRHLCVEHPDPVPPPRQVPTIAPPREADRIGLLRKTGVRHGLIVQAASRPVFPPCTPPRGSRPAAPRVCQHAQEL